MLDLVVEEGCPDLPPLKVFKPKFNLAKLQDYKGPAPSSYWGRFPTNKDFPGKSKIDPVQLRALAAEYGAGSRGTTWTFVWSTWNKGRISVAEGQRDSRLLA